MCHFVAEAVAYSEKKISDFEPKFGKSDLSRIFADIAVYP